MEYYLGLDIGGTFVKGACMTAEGNLLAEDKCDTGCENGGYVMCDNIAALSEKLQSKIKGQLSGVGVGCPGMIESSRGVVKFAGNLGLRNFPLGDELAKRLGVPVKVTNDANAAALGEARFGAGKNFKNSILVTLGTGVGGGIIIDGKLYEGGSSAGTEIGHMVIERHGEMCTCGRRGCFERYSSASALTRYTKHAMEEDAGSAMWGKYTSDTCTGKTAFEFMNVDRTAKEVVDWYIKYLACGLINLANIFRPEVIMLGGGVAAQGERLTKPLQKIMDKEIFGGNDYARVLVVPASLGNSAGAMGAAALCLD
ncbi:MAG TPA: ROK family protein [Candidatus Coproplasma avicola]|uniref:ROK family protein n=1 Tax=Candidatus Coproplasma avicola TaxID=2840744 RepID=A0A9D1J9C8_9FIRM|nr:ROK family protein [Candidatus Coproplasma avicola]